MDEVTWYIVEYPSKVANEGRVLWDTETKDLESLADRLKNLQIENPEKDYEISNLSDAPEVFVETFGIGACNIH